MLKPYSEYTQPKCKWNPKKPAQEPVGMPFKNTNRPSYSSYSPCAKSDYTQKKPAQESIGSPFKNPSYTSYSKYTALKSDFTQKKPANQKKYTSIIDYKKCQPYTYTNFTPSDKPYTPCPCNSKNKSEKMAPTTKAFRRRKLLPKM